MIKFLFFILAFLQFFTATANENKDLLEHKKMMMVTIPKSGTNLLRKCLSLMVKDIPAPGTTLRPKKTLIDITHPISKTVAASLQNKEKNFIAGHLIHTPEAEEFIEKNVRNNFFNIRDPRAQLVSAAYVAQKRRVGGNKKTIEDILISFITGDKNNFLPSPKQKNFKTINPDHVVMTLDLLWLHGAYKFYQFFLPWMNAKTFYTVRFENLVGANGGGSDQAQLQEIKNIAQHIGVRLSDKKAKRIAKNLFGGTRTFREGQVSSWRKHFTPEVTAAFKADAGLMQLLIDLRYEKDTNW